MTGAGAIILLLSIVIGIRRVPYGGQLAWPVAPPESLNLDRARLESLWADLRARQTTAFLVVRGGHLVFERYAPFHGGWRRQGLASATKGIVATCALVLAIGDGHLALDDPAWRYIPAWQADPARAAISVRDLAGHSAGFAPVDTMPPTGWSRAYWQRSPSLFSSAIHEVPVEAVPGSRFRYDPMAYVALSLVLAESIARASDGDLAEQLDRRVMRPLGIPRRAWRIGYAARPHLVGGIAVYPLWSGSAMTPRAAARIGQLVLQMGEWRGRTLLDSAAVADAVWGSAFAAPPDESWPMPTAGWWSNRNGVWPALPSDAVVAAGADGQFVLVVPSLDLVALRLGGAIGEQRFGARFWSDFRELFIKPLAAAVTDHPT